MERIYLDEDNSFKILENFTKKNIMEIIKSRIRIGNTESKLTLNKNVYLFI